MAKQLLDTDLIDVQLVEEILAAVERAEVRGVQGPTIFGSLIGPAVSVAKENDAPLSDLFNVVDVCYNCEGETTVTAH